MAESNGRKIPWVRLSSWRHWGQSSAEKAARGRAEAEGIQFREPAAARGRRCTAMLVGFMARPVLSERAARGKAALAA
jgi:hypothetical protein